MHTTVKICTLKYLFPASNLLTQQCVVVHQNSAAAIYAVEVKACCLLKSMLLLSRYYTTGLYNNYTTLSQNMISWWFEMLVTLHCDSFRRWSKVIIFQIKDCVNYLNYKKVWTISIFILCIVSYPCERKNLNLLT